MEKCDKLLEKELDIIRIVKSIRLLKKEEENNFIIDLTEDDDNSNISQLEKTQTINIIEI